MEVAALIAWVFAVIAGFYLLGVWLANDGLKQQATKVTRFPSAIVLGHPLLALIGLVVWVMYLFTGSAAYAWSAFTVLLVVTGLGFIMLTRWLVGLGGRHARGAEQAFPLVAVVLHGAVALITFVLVFLAAIAVSQG